VRERPAQAARRLAGVPGEALAEFPAARSERGRAVFGCRSAPLADPAIAEMAAATPRTGSIARTTAERAGRSARGISLAWIERGATGEVLTLARTAGVCALASAAGRLTQAARSVSRA